MAKFKTVVKRSEWLRGKGEGWLLNDAGLKCCLGFRCEQAGIPSKDLMDTDMPYEVPGKSILPHWLRVRFGSKAANIAGVNDDATYSDVNREARLKQLFAERGEEIEFVD